MKNAVESLWSIRNRYGSKETTRKRALLSQLGERLPRSARDRRRLHDTLLFILAHPDSKAIAILADNLLASLNGELEANASDARALEGIAGATLSTTFTFDAAQWLATNLPDDVDIDWSDDEALARLERLLPLLIARVERDGLATAGLTTEDWVRMAAGTVPPIAWLLDRLTDAIPDARTRDHLWDGLDLRIEWRLRPETSRSGARLLHRKPVTFPRGLTRAFDPAKEIARSAPRPERLHRSDAERVIHTVRASMFSRERETDAVTYANTEEVYRVEIEHGVDVYLFGLAPERRLPIESYFGYLATRNSLPVAYGGGWVFLGQCETGISVLEEFRSGESAWLYAQILRVFRSTFDINHFHVDPYQIGYENEEAIQSGAFWFYYRLGFRPADAALESLAAEEAATIAAKRGHRTSARLLRRFATEPVVLHVTLEPGDLRTEPIALDGLALSLTRSFAETSETGRASIEKKAMRALVRRLDLELAAATAEQRRCIARLSPLFAKLDIGAWSKRDKARLCTCLLAKGGERELDYTLALRRLRRLRTAIDQSFSSAAALSRSE